MEFTFDISQEELPIFQAETEDHLQILDEGLIRLERQDYDPDLVQQIFRAAHTLKGTAGMIGHQRLVQLTHALEMAFDGIRKNELVINSHLVDICLDAVDALRLLRDEVIQGKASPVDVNSLVNQINDFIRKEKEASQAFAGQFGSGSPSSISPASASGKPAEAPTQQADEGLWVEAHISPASIASAARAFQLMLVLQDMGEILSMEPSQEEIESAKPVTVFRAKLKTSHTAEELKKELDLISEIDSLSIHANGSQPESGTNTGSAVIVNALNLEPYSEEIAPHLGEHLISKGLINQAQLDQALEIQKQRDGKPLVGHILVEIGLLTPAQLDAAIADLLQQQRKTIQNLQQAAGEQTRGKTAEKTVRTSVERLDSLMNLVGELITDRNRLFKIRSDLDVRMRGSEDLNFLIETVTHVGRITDQLQEEVMRIRMVPVSNVFNKYPRMVRDLAQKVGKEINFVIQGQDTELDRSVIEEINDPLIHLLRNSVDHGVESPQERLAKGKPAAGTVRLTARHEQGHIVLTVEDDGRGINVDKLKQSAVQKGFLTEAEANALPPEKGVDLIFISGLTTAKTLSDISGRGVGMDIVRSNIEKINGSILVETHPDAGTKFQIILPLTLAIVPTMLVKVGPTAFAIPLMTVTETLRIKPEETHTVNGQPVIILRKNVLPILKLGEVFDVPMSESIQQYSYVVVVTANKIRLGLVVDSLIGEEEVVVKSLSGMLGEITGISSAAILGDGQVALIVDIAGLLKLAGIH